MKARFIDTNVFLRYLTADDRVKYNKCKALFERAVNGGETLVTSDMVIAEVVWTLLSYYKTPKSEIVEKVSIILNTPNIEVKNYRIITEALAIYSVQNIDFIDAYNAVFMKHNKTEEIYSYDKDFDGVDFLRRIEP
ncbi:MAG: PIN domain-containing protein [Thermodesulfobacteriota bacterium]